MLNSVFGESLMAHLDAPVTHRDLFDEIDVRITVTAIPGDDHNGIGDPSNTGSCLVLDAADQDWKPAQLPIPVRGCDFKVPLGRQHELWRAISGISIPPTKITHAPGLYADVCRRGPTGGVLNISRPHFTITATAEYL